jgi:hypothetical protein
VAVRFPCHLCLAAERTVPREKHRKLGLSRKPYAIAADGTGRNQAGQGLSAGRNRVPRIRPGSDSGHISTTECLKRFRRWLG